MATSRPDKPKTNPGAGYEWVLKGNKWVKGPKPGSKGYGPMGIRFGPNGPPSLPKPYKPSFDTLWDVKTAKQGTPMRPVPKPGKPIVKPASTSNKPATTSGRSGGGTGSGRGGGSSTGASKSNAKKPVLQQNTMWVTAAESKTGKGYLAQKGKPEKRVTGNVKIQATTTSGKAAGSTYSYSKGKTVGKVVKKK